MPFTITRVGVQVVALIGGLAFLVTSCVVRDRSIEQRGATKVTSAIAKQTEKINAKARKARDAARAPGAVDRVRNAFCRDCD